MIIVMYIVHGSMISIVFSWVILQATCNGAIHLTFGQINFKLYKQSPGCVCVNPPSCVENSIILEGILLSTKILKNVDPGIFIINFTKIFEIRTFFGTFLGGFPLIRSKTSKISYNHRTKYGCTRIR